MCSCLLAPDTNTTFRGEEERLWCEDDCPVKIESREYVNCTEREIIYHFLDFDHLSFVQTPVEESLAESGAKRKIKVTEVQLGENEYNRKYWFNM